MIRLGEQAVELAQENVRVPVLHELRAPEVRGNGACTFGVAARHQGPDEGDGALGRFGLLFTKCGERLLCRRLLEEQGVLIKARK
jgi:hypothetical protein